jgi:LysR family transcriptional regulator of gallate degradation
MQVLLALAGTTSQAIAATALGISQPAVQQSLAQLEHLAGKPLFLRARNGLRLTELGEAAVKAVKLALAELQQADEELALQQGATQGRLVIGTLPFSTVLLVPEAVDRVYQAHPGLGITIVDGTYDALVHQLRHADIDLMLGALRPAPPGPDLQQEELFVDKLSVVAGASHPLARRSGLRWQDLADARWIMPMPNTPAEAAFVEALQAAGVPHPPSPLRVNSALMMQSLLAQSDRLAMMSPRHIQREIDAGLLVVLDLPVQHAPRTIGLLMRTGYLPTPGAQVLLDALRDFGHKTAAEVARG